MKNGDLHGPFIRGWIVPTFFGSLVSAIISAAIGLFFKLSHSDSALIGIVIFPIALTLFRKLTKHPD